MIILRNRNKGRYTQYALDTTANTCTLLQEVDSDEILDSTGRFFCVDSYSLRVKNQSCSIPLPDLINQNVVRRLKALKIEVVIPLLNLDNLEGNQLLRFAYQGKRWVTDGTSIGEYDSTQDPRVKFTDTTTKYLFDSAMVIHKEIIPMFIVLLTNNSSNYFVYTKVPDESMLEFYDSPNMDFIKDLYEYSFNFTSDPRCRAKVKFLHLIILVFLLGNTRLPTSEIYRIVSYCSENTSTHQISYLLLKGFNMPHDHEFHGIKTLIDDDYEPPKKVTRIQ